MKPAPIVFVSYSHDSKEHSDWVLQLAKRLRSNGVDATLDRWDVRPGQDLATFMEKGLTSSHRVLCICSQAYVAKANAGSGGVGYEKHIITSVDPNRGWVIPVIRNNPLPQKLPTFLGRCLYIDFEEDCLYDSKYDELLRALLDEPVLPVPPLGKNPFETAREYTQQPFIPGSEPLGKNPFETAREYTQQPFIPGSEPLGKNPFETAREYTQQPFIPGSEKYVPPATKGKVIFNYSNNNGKYRIGSGAYMFETKWSKASDQRIHIYNDPPSIRTVALVTDKQEISSIDDAQVYDGSSRSRKPSVGQIVLIQNVNGFFAALKVLNIKDDTRGSPFDELTFEYVIQTNGTPDFTKSNIP